MNNIEKLESLEKQNPIPLPLTRQIEEPERFPFEAMIGMSDAVIAIQDVTQSPLAICAQSIIAASTMATQALADVMTPMGQAHPISNFFVTIAGSGERKSTCDNEAVKGILTHERKLRDQYEFDIQNYIIEKKAYDLAINKAEKGKKTRSEIETALKNVEEPPSPPLDPILLCPDPTIEGLYKLLASGQPSMGVFSAEGGQFIGGYGMNGDNRLKTAAAFSCLWDGSVIHRVRALDGASSLYGKRVSAHLMVQPDVAQKLLSDSLISDQGLLSRILCVAPASTAGTRLWKPPSPSSQSRIAAYNSHIENILSQPLSLAEKKKNELELPNIGLTPQALGDWVLFHDEAEIGMAKDGKYSSIRNLANKIPEHAMRLAAVIALYNNPQAREINQECLRGGIILARYYLSEALRLQGAGYISSEIQTAHELLNWLQTKWDNTYVSLPDIYQRSTTKLREKAAANKSVGILEDHGWLVKSKSGMKIDGEFRREVWEIISV